MLKRHGTSEEQSKIPTTFLRMTSIGGLTCNRRYGTEPKITAYTCAINDVIKKNKQSFVKEINPRMLPLSLTKVMYNE